MVGSDDDHTAEVSEVITYFTSLRGLPDTDGLALAMCVTDMIRGHKAKAARRRTRRKIKDEFDGTNIAEITERYGVSRATVYRIAAE